MFVDARRLPNNTDIQSDVCIIGAGAAGITIAKAFAGESFKVCLLESGGLEPSKETQSLYAGENVGLKYPIERTRTRCFGGSTKRWAGFCRPIEENAFKHRQWVPHSGWPLDMSELIPYYKEAQRICELGPFIYSPDYWRKKEPEFKKIPFARNRAMTGIYQFSQPPTHFGKSYREEVEKASNIITYLNANITNIETSENGQKVTRVHGVTLEKNKFLVSAKIFVVATGGIENARLLLLSNDCKGVGNQHDIVGRYFMEHPHLVRLSLGGKIIAPMGGVFTDNCMLFCSIRQKIDGVPLKMFLYISEKMQEKEKLLNFSITLLGPKPYNPKDSFQNALGEMILDLDSKKNKQYTVFDMRIRAEQAPNPESRVTLSRRRDRLGLNQVKLDWRLSPMDIRSIRKSTQILGEEFGGAGLGRVTIFDDNELSWKKKIRGGAHHMGTTRMSSDPKKGVVDKNCRVHDVSNMYIAGSSVFPVAGSANPTLTIVALSLRLAEHIRGIMS